MDRFTRRFKSKMTSKRVINALLLLMLVVLMLAPTAVSFAQTATPVPPTTAPVALEIDMNPLFEAINTYFPIMFGIFAVAGGITIAMVLAKFLINAIKGAFEGKNL